jgi:hypothetical protein
VTPFDSEEAIRIANDVNAGLAAHFYTEDMSRLWRVSEALEAGTVGCRVGLVSACEQPFGGTKDSGTGREGSRFALDEYVNTKSISVVVRDGFAYQPCCFRLQHWAVRKPSRLESARNRRVLEIESWFEE